MRVIPDLSRPILYEDEETGEVILGGEDSPRADELRAELDEKRKRRLMARYNKGGQSSANGTNDGAQVDSSSRIAPFEMTEETS